MSNMLEQIVKDKKESLFSVKKHNSLEVIERKIKELDCFLDFKQRIEENPKVSLNHFDLIMVQPFLSSAYDFVYELFLQIY